MGMTYWLNVRDGDMIESEENDLSATCKLTDTLDRVCLELGVLAVSEFVDSTEISLEAQYVFQGLIPAAAKVRNAVPPRPVS